MQQALTYQTSYMEASYSIFNNNTPIGKLYKTEWLGPTIDTTIQGHHFRFVSTGFFKTTISVFDKDTQQDIGIVTINNIFVFRLQQLWL